MRKLKHMDFSNGWFLFVKIQLVLHERIYSGFIQVIHASNSRSFNEYAYLFRIYVQFINDNGGFTIAGWYKRGVINDNILCASQTINDYNGWNTAAKYSTS